MARKLLYIVIGVVAGLLIALPAAADNPHPSEVDIALEAGDSFHLVPDKEVTTPTIPPVVDICLVEDETGSFADDIATLQALAGAGGPLITALDGTGADYATCVIGYRDFAQSFWGSPGDHVYRRLSDVSPGGAGFVAGVPLLTAGGGGDGPEAQLEALHYLATPGHAAIDSNGDSDTTDANDTAAGLQPTWRAGSQRVVLLTTDASCHVTGDAGGWPGDAGTTSPAVTGGILSAAGITVIGLTPGGAGTIGCVDTLAAATGGSVHATGASGATIVAAILAGLEELTTDVWWEIGPCDAGLTVTLSPTVRQDVLGNTTVTFSEDIAVAADVPVGTRLHCTVTFIANEFPDEGAPIGEETIWVKVIDIDIKPFSFPNSINTKSMGLVPVAILSGPDFDATTDVDLTVPILFGPGGANPVHLPFTAAELATHTALDVDGNGFNDLVLHFRQKDAGIASGDTSACLTFTELDGVVATACDSVRPLH